MTHSRPGSYHYPAGELQGLLWLLAGTVEDGLGRVAGRQLFALYQPLGDERWRQISPAGLLDLAPPPVPYDLPADYGPPLEQLGADYWLYIVTEATRAPVLYLVRDPAGRLPREEVVPQVRYRVRQEGWRRVAEEALSRPDPKRGIMGACSRT